jgi:hypothetical protein
LTCRQLLGNPRLRLFSSYDRNQAFEKHGGSSSDSLPGDFLSLCELFGTTFCSISGVLPQRQRLAHVSRIELDTFMCRERERNRRARTSIRRSPQTPIVGFHDGAANPQPFDGADSMVRDLAKAFGTLSEQTAQIESLERRALSATLVRLKSLL